MDQACEAALPVSSRLRLANISSMFFFTAASISRPAIEAPFAGLLSGEVAPFVSPLAHVTARGYNLYFPIPYSRRCVVTVDSIVVEGSSGSQLRFRRIGRGHVA